MQKIAIVYWSGTGNTEIMAQEIAAGARGAGAEASLFNAADFKPELAGDYDRIAFGCPAMGAEELEDTEFLPMFTAVERSLSGKEIALFGSYDWGDGQWMRDWQEQCIGLGAKVLGGEGLILNETPDEDGLAQCRKLGGLLAG